MINKQLLLILLIGLIAISAFSQSKKIVKNEDNEVYTSVEQSAEYPGGMIKFNSYFFKNLHYYPDTTIGLRTHLGLQFIVEKDGSLSKITVLKSINPKQIAMLLEF